MGRGDRAGASGRCMTEQAIGCQSRDRRTHPHDIHQAVDRSHLMKMHLIRCGAVDASLSLSQRREDSQHPFLQRRSKRGPADLNPEIGPVTMV